jgi:hypothetical protein
MACVAEQYIVSCSLWYAVAHQLLELLNTFAGFSRYGYRVFIAEGWGGSEIAFVVYNNGRFAML